MEENRPLFKEIELSAREFKATMLRRDGDGFAVQSVQDQFNAYKAGCKRAKAMRMVDDE